MKLVLLFFLALLVGCSSSAPRYKRMFVDLRNANCHTFVDDHERRFIDGLGGERFQFEVCAMESMPDPPAYRGPVALQVRDRLTNEILAEERWETIAGPPYRIVAGTGAHTFHFSDSMHEFEWTATHEMMNAPHPPLPFILDYPLCARVTAATNKEATSGFLFEYCYLTDQDPMQPWEDPKGSPGILRLSFIPEGDTIRIERLRRMDISDVEFHLKDQAVRFENEGKKTEWSLGETGEAQK